LEEKSHSIDRLLGDESFHRWVLGKSSGEEAAKWETWVQASPDNMVQADKAAKILRELKIVARHPVGEQDALRQWSKLKHNIHGSDNSSLMLPFETRNAYTHWHAAIRYAAVILIIMLAGYAYWQHKISARKTPSKVAMVEMSTKYGQQKIIKLSDGSRIHLAPNSHLRYAENWLQQPVRKLHLDGEAYFDIKGVRQPGKPEFEIRTDDGVIHDIGTQFNVSTFHNHTSVVLKRGVVTVQSNTGKDQPVVRLKPGQMAVINSNKSDAEITQVNPEVYTSWSTNLLVFDHTPLQQFVQTLKDLYGVDVVAKDPSLLQRELTGNIEKQNLGTILKAVSKVLNINIYKRGQTVYLAN